MLWYIVKRKDNNEELARVNSMFHVAKLAKRKANEYETEVKIEREAHDEGAGTENGQD